MLPVNTRNPHFINFPRTLQATLESKSPLCSRSYNAWTPELYWLRNGCRVNQSRAGNSERWKWGACAVAEAAGGSQAQQRARQHAALAARVEAEPAVYGSCLGTNCVGCALGRAGLQSPTVCRVAAATTKNRCANSALNCCKMHSTLKDDSVNL